MSSCGMGLRGDIGIERDNEKVIKLNNWEGFFLVVLGYVYEGVFALYMGQGKWEKAI